jgi:hypothetical protein
MKLVKRLLVAVALLVIAFVNHSSAYTWEHDLPASCYEMQDLCQSYCGALQINFICYDYGEDSSGSCECETGGGGCQGQFDYCDGWNECCYGLECHLDIHECIPEY